MWILKSVKIFILTQGHRLQMIFRENAAVHPFQSRRMSKELPAFRVQVGCFRTSNCRVQHSIDRQAQAFGFGKVNFADAVREFHGTKKRAALEDRRKITPHRLTSRSSSQRGR